MFYREIGGPIFVEYIEGAGVQHLQLRFNLIQNEIERGIDMEKILVVRKTTLGIQKQF